MDGMSEAHYMYNYIDLLICCAIVEGEKAFKPIKLSKGLWNVKSTCYYQIYLYEILFWYSSLANFIISCLHAILKCVSICPYIL